MELVEKFKDRKDFFEIFGKGDCKKMHLNSSGDLAGTLKLILGKRTEDDIDENTDYGDRIVDAIEYSNFFRVLLDEDNP